MPFGEAREKKALDDATGKSPEAARQLALLTSAPTGKETGAELKAKELKYKGYARKATAAADWNAASGHEPATATNKNELAFPEWEEGADEKATHLAVLNGEEQVAWEELTDPKTGEPAPVTVGAGNRNPVAPVEGVAVKLT